MHRTEPQWGVDLQIGWESARTAYSTNDYPDLLVNRLERAHEVVRGHLGISAVRMKDWYDKKVNAQSFTIRNEVYVLNLLLYKGRTPKWIRRYSHVTR